MLHMLFSGLAVLITASPLIEQDLSNSRIVNGDAVSINQVPYQGLLTRKVNNGWSSFCGGVIITNKAVLTAGHCAIG